jgi:hypothetical protein
MAAYRGLLGGPVAAAAASVLGLEVVTAQGTYNSDDKTVTVHCPAGKKVIDAGGYIASGFGQVATGGTAELHNGTGTVVLTQDGVDLSGEFAGAEDNDAETPGWWVTAYVFCVDA